MAAEGERPQRPEYGTRGKRGYAAAGLRLDHSGVVGMNDPSSTPRLDTRGGMCWGKAAPAHPAPGYPDRERWPRR